MTPPIVKETVSINSLKTRESVGSIDFITIVMGFAWIVEVRQGSTRFSVKVDVPEGMPALFSGSLMVAVTGML